MHVLYGEMGSSQFFHCSPQGPFCVLAERVIDCSQSILRICSLFRTISVFNVSFIAKVFNPCEYIAAYSKVFWYQFEGSPKPLLPPLSKPMGNIKRFWTVKGEISIFWFWWMMKSFHHLCRVEPNVKLLDEIYIYSTNSNQVNCSSCCLRNLISFQKNWRMFPFLCSTFHRNFKFVICVSCSIQVHCAVSASHLKRLLKISNSMHFNVRPQGRLWWPFARDAAWIQEDAPIYIFHSF